MNTDRPQDTTEMVLYTIWQIVECYQAISGVSSSRMQERWTISCGARTAIKPLVLRATKRECGIAHHSLWIVETDDV
ncbi:hypothetical protein HZH68_014087 [Vespula germanica]|uniref:Uncharacterized protein n=1 Tax=Vespula germanica TaxID=30212 RepID=A0A834JAI4_VESGE|nr:hypothetical protein HZH68_014087 [Vespula germanica]